MNIFIIGPGGVGKSTIGKILATKLGLKLIDLDQEFIDTIGDITNYIKTKGYEKYYKKNSDLFFSLLNKNISNYIFILSSGFLTYTEELTNKHLKMISKNGISILLLPSKSLKECTKIIIERQLSRGLNLEYEKEKEKFKIRFLIYKKHGDIKIFSHKNPNEIVNEIIVRIKKIYSL